ncbi:MAG: DegV family protein [Lachnospiraceae bacterium]|nr:DegV family protein [Lachnospiraceae bacterium]
MTVRVMADSTCDLSFGMVQDLGIIIVPLHIVLGEEEYLDGKDITPDKIYRWSDEHNDTPKTSAVGLREAMEAIEEAGVTQDTNDELIIFTISEKMSVTANAFRIAAEELEVADRVSVIDSANLSTGIGLMVVEAAHMAKKGMDRKKIVAEIERIKPLVRASFVVDTLTYLHRGGRCSGVAALAGGVLKLHPMIVVKDGEMGATKKYRGKMESVIMDYVKELEPQLKKARKDRVFITHSGCKSEVVSSVYNYLTKMDYFKEIIITRAGGVISSHCGPGTLGVLFIEGE